MKMKSPRIRSFVVFLAAAVCGILLGFLLKPWIVGDRSHHDVGVSPSAGTSVLQSPSILSKRSNADTAMSAALAKVPRAQRYLWLAAKAEKASLEELARLYQLANREGHRDLRRAIAFNWAGKDPSHMFESLKDWGEDDFRIYRVLFDQWAKMDGEAALTKVLESDKDKRFRDWGMYLWSALMRENPAIAVRARKDLAGPGFTASTSKVAEWAGRDPRAAADMVMNHMPKRDHMTWEIMGAIGKVWGKQDPEAALNFALGLDSYSTRGALAASAMSAWTEDDPEAAAEFLSHLEDPDLRFQLGNGLVSGLAKSDPEAALNWADAHLKSSARINAIGRVIQSVASEDIEAAAQLVAGMEPGGTLNGAVTALIDVWSKDGGSQNEAMLTWLGSLTDIEARDRAIRSLEWRMDMITEGGLVKFVEGEHGYLAPVEMVRRAALQRARQDPQTAAEWARALPGDRAETALAAVMAAWRENAPEAAAAWETASDDS